LFVYTDIFLFDPQFIYYSSDMQASSSPNLPILWFGTSFWFFQCWLSEYRTASLKRYL